MPGKLADQGQTLLSYIRSNHDTYTYKPPQTSYQYPDLPNRLLDPVAAMYRIESSLGQGSYGKVKLGIHRETGEKVAIKFIHKASIKKPSHLVRIRREVRLHRLLSHPHIIKLQSVFETRHDIVLVMEYASGGELADLIESRGRLDESQSRHVFRQIASSLEYLHANCIIHRDLKPQNIMLGEAGNLDTVKLVDFGFSSTFDPLGLCSTFCGSPFYASPEMILGEEYCGPQVDVWSLGIVLYFMVTGKVPFHDSSTKGLYGKILAGRYEMPANVSPDLANLIQRTLLVQRSERIGLGQILEHPWMNWGTEKPRCAPVDQLGQGELDHYILVRLADLGFEDAQEKIRGNPEGREARLYRLIREWMGRETRRARRHGHAELQLFDRVFPRDEMDQPRPTVARPESIFSRVFAGRV